VTAYGYDDNDPPSAQIAYPGKYKLATEGSGTYNSPITFASVKSEFAPGTSTFILSFIIPTRTVKSLSGALTPPPAKVPKRKSSNLLPLPCVEPHHSHFSFSISGVFALCSKVHHHGRPLRTMPEGLGQRQVPLGPLDRPTKVHKLSVAQCMRGQDDSLQHPYLRQSSSKPARGYHSLVHLEWSMHCCLLQPQQRPAYQ